jgi:hypothetical protein
MLLKEMFSPVGGPKENDQDVDWAADLKFFIDNDNKMLGNYIFPTVEKHKKYVGNPDVWKLYVQPVKQCLKHYLEKYEVENSKEKFDKYEIQKLAKKISEEQEQFITKGDYNED